MRISNQKTREKLALLNLNNELKNTKNARGITLIALVVTIIVLLILAGITINLILSDDGIFKKAEDAKEAQKKAEVTDRMSLILTDYIIEEKKYKKDLMEYMEEQVGKNITSVKDGTDTITVEKEGYTFVIDKETLEILSSEKNTKSVRVEIAKIAKLKEVLEAKVLLGDDMKALKYAYNTQADEIGLSEDGTIDGEISFTSSPIELSASTQEFYYLHLLVKDTKTGDTKEHIFGPVKVGNYVEKIELNKTEITLETGATETLTTTVGPEDASNKTVNWISSDETVATVDSTGKITAIKAGNAIITAEAADGSGTKASCTLKVIQKVTAISFSETTATVDQGKTLTLTPNITPEDASNKTLTWTSSATAVATVDNTGKVTGLTAGTTTITVATTDGSNKSATCEVTVKEVESDWALISKIAKEISNNSSTITKASAQATVEVEGTSYTLKVGDTYKLRDESGDLKTVRILGFNHDKLTNTSAYGGSNTYAGISFEFVDFLSVNGSTTAQMNSSNTNSGGWGACPLRTTLNSTTVTNLSNTSYIKQVQKSYIATYNDASSVTTCNDSLWLLSCSEIWDNGYTTGAYGLAITKEGDQYKYYVDNLASTAYDANSNVTKKPTMASPEAWWLRSTRYNFLDAFCRVSINGGCGNATANVLHGVTPGFSI